jgi:hypothetical protein
MGRLSCSRGVLIAVGPVYPAAAPPCARPARDPPAGLFRPRLDVPSDVFDI